MAKFIGKHNFPKSILEHEENKNRGISIKKKKVGKFVRELLQKQKAQSFLEIFNQT